MNEHVILLVYSAACLSQKSYYKRHPSTILYIRNVRNCNRTEPQIEIILAIDIHSYSGTFNEGPGYRQNAA